MPVKKFLTKVLVFQSTGIGIRSRQNFLVKTQGDHALFRPWEFLRKITKNLYNGIQGFNIL